MTNTKVTEFKLKLNSKAENISLVEPFVQKIQKHYRFDEEAYYNILLVLTEAVNNSIIHGNQQDPHKKVLVNSCLRRQKLQFTIQDEGKGFNHRRVQDPTAPDRIACPNGRGVFLMRSLSDQIRFSDQGRKVEIRFAM